jgi:hypothetical protein
LAPSLDVSRTKRGLVVEIDEWVGLVVEAMVLL